MKTVQISERTMTLLHNVAEIENRPIEDVVRDAVARLMDELIAERKNRTSAQPATVKSSPLGPVLTAGSDLPDDRTFRKRPDPPRLSTVERHRRNPTLSERLTSEPCAACAKATSADPMVGGIPSLPNRLRILATNEHIQRGGWSGTVREAADAIEQAEAMTTEAYSAQREVE